MTCRRRWTPTGSHRTSARCSSPTAHWNRGDFLDRVPDALRLPRAPVPEVLGQAFDLDPDPAPRTTLRSLLHTPGDGALCHRRYPDEAASEGDFLGGYLGQASGGDGLSDLLRRFPVLDRRVDDGGLLGTGGLGQLLGLGLEGSDGVDHLFVYIAYFHMRYVGGVRGDRSHAMLFTGAASVFSRSSCSGSCPTRSNRCTATPIRRSRRRKVQTRWTIACSKSRTRR